MVSRPANMLSIISLLNRQMLLQFSLALYNTSIGFLLLKFEDLRIRKIVFFIGCLFCVAKLEVFSNVVQNFVLLWPMVLRKVFQYIFANQFLYSSRNTCSCPIGDGLKWCWEPGTCIEKEPTIYMETGFELGCAVSYPVV